MVRHIGNQQQFSIHEFSLSLCGFINGVAEQVGLQVHLDDARQMRFTDLVIQPRFGTAVGELSAPADNARILPIEFAHPLIGFGKYGGYTLPPQFRLLLRLFAIVGNHQTQFVPPGLVDNLLFGVSNPALEVLEDLCKLAVPAPRHRQNELQRLAVGKHYFA